MLGSSCPMALPYAVGASNLQNGPAGLLRLASRRWSLLSIGQATQLCPSRAVPGAMHGAYVIPSGAAAATSFSKQQCEERELKRHGRQHAKRCRGSALHWRLRALVSAQDWAHTHRSCPPGHDRATAAVLRMDPAWSTQFRICNTAAVCEAAGHIQAIKADCSTDLHHNYVHV